MTPQAREELRQQLLRKGWSVQLVPGGLAWHHAKRRIAVDISGESTVELVAAIQDAIEHKG